MTRGDLLTFGDQLWSRLARYQCSGDDNVDFSTLFVEKFHLSFNELFRHRFGIATSSRAIFLDLNFDEFGSEGLNLLTSC